MSVSAISIRKNVLQNSEFRPVFRFAVGMTFIMAFAVIFGGYMGYIIPLLAVNFLMPGAKSLTIKQGFGFIFMVVITSLFAFLFVSVFYHYTFAFILLLALILFYTFYTARISIVVKLFLVMELLSFPVPASGIDPSLWAVLVGGTMIYGAISSVLVVWMVFLLFPDNENKTEKNSSTKSIKIPSKKVRIENALTVFLVTFPVVLLFIFYRWSDQLLILIYIVILAMMPDAGQVQGKIKVFGNILGGMITFVFYELLVVVPYFPFFVIMFLGISLFFSNKIFNGKVKLSSIYRTGFSALILIIGNVIAFSSKTATSEISNRILLIFIAVLYVVTVFYFINIIKARISERESLNKIIT